MAFPIQNLVLWTVDHNSNQGGIKHLPFVGWMAFYALHKVHGCWYWYRKADIWKPDNWFQLSLGMGIHLLAGDNRVVKMVAKVTEIALHTLKAAEAFTRLKHSCNCLGLLLLNEKAVHIEIDRYQFLQKKSYLSPSTRIWVEIKRQEVIKKTHLIIDCIYNIFCDLYFVSMHILDADLAYHGDFLKVQVIEMPVHAAAIYRCNTTKIGEDLLRGFGMQGVQLPTNSRSLILNLSFFFP